MCVRRGRDPRPEVRPFRSRDRAARPPDRGHAARATARGSRGAASSRHDVSRDARRAAARRRPQHPAAARGLQVSRRPRRQLRPPRQPDCARRRPLAADLLGARQVQVVAGAATSAKGDWTMARGRRNGSARRRQGARQRFIAAMDAWDESAADAAVAGARPAAAAHRNSSSIFCRYGARDFRDIGHKAIYVANSWRTLQTIGWQHAEPVLRSLAYALLEHEGENPVDSATPTADRPGRRNLELVERIRAGWQRRQAETPTRPRSCSRRCARARPKRPARRVVELLNRGVGPAIALGCACSSTPASC